jgi:hypothetical protein
MVCHFDYDHPVVPTVNNWWGSVHAVVSILQNVSVGIAFFGLLRFCHVIKHTIEKDFSYQFLSIKLVVFLTFWQGMLIHAVSHFGYPSVSAT